MSASVSVAVYVISSKGGGPQHIVDLSRVPCVGETILVYLTGIRNYAPLTVASVMHHDMSRGDHKQDAVVRCYDES